MNINKIINQYSFIDDDLILEYFDFQYKNCDIYRKYTDMLGIKVKSVNDIPFLPIHFFKTKKIYASNLEPEVIFTSSGTTGQETSKHYVADNDIYTLSYMNGFRYFFGEVSDYTILALLPSYLERQGSSLITMAEGLISASGSEFSGFFLNNHDDLYTTLQILKEKQKKTILIGVSFALLDFSEKYNIDFPELIVMETGGMKGRREEITRNELHYAICKGFGVKTVYSEYGMTELLSQAYSKGNGIYHAPQWLKIIIRDPKDPFKRVPYGTAGGINIIDLANLYSCSFIETQDLGIMHPDGGFEVIGRFDESDIRGCNLMI